LLVDTNAPVNNVGCTKRVLIDDTILLTVFRNVEKMADSMQDRCSRKYKDFLLISLSLLASPWPDV
jgi:hypothetical protein